jgi:WD40 repeat protein
MKARREAVADTPVEIERTGALALESIEIAQQRNWPAEADAIEPARSALIRLPLAVLPHGGGRVMSVAVLPDGRLASGGDDAKIKLWPKDGTGGPVVFSHDAHVRSLAVLRDGRLVSGGEDGRIELWPTGGYGRAGALSQGRPVWSLAVLPDGRLASGGEDGRIKLWPTEGKGEPAVLSHGSAVNFLAVLPDGRLASGGANGKIKLWPKDAAERVMTVTRFLRGVGEPVVLSYGSPVFSLAVLPDGRFASGGIDGKINLWPKDGRGKPMALSHGGPGVSDIRVNSLAVLADGRLASGGDDGNIKLWRKDGTGEPRSSLARQPGLVTGGASGQAAGQRRL